MMGATPKRTRGVVEHRDCLNIVLVEPEIPGNTGTIGRLCVGLNANLWLIEPLGFSLEDKYVRRAGLDYWPDLKLSVLPNLTAFYALPGMRPERCFYYTTKTETPYTHGNYAPGDFLIFGRETKGLSEDLLAENPQQTYTIPMYGPTRSINLAISVGIVAYEAMRQIKKGF